MSRRSDRHQALFLALGAVLVLGGCAEDYLDRRDTIASSSGNAVEANAVTHIIDPWPAQAANTRLTTDGQRVQGAVERYRSGETVTPRIAPLGAGIGSQGGGAPR